MKGNDSAGENWEQQVDYPVPPEQRDTADAQQAVSQGEAQEHEAFSGGEPLSREERIRLQAYYRAERRGFNGGSEQEDWLEAEREVDGGESARDRESRR
jgi:hypothetical protein